MHILPSDTDTAHNNLNQDSNLPADDSVSPTQWPPPRATELLVAVTPRDKVSASRKTRRKRQVAARKDAGQEAEGVGGNGDAEDTAGSAAAPE